MSLCHVSRFKLRSRLPNPTRTCCELSQWLTACRFTVHRLIGRTACIKDESQIFYPFPRSRTSRRGRGFKRRLSHHSNEGALCRISPNLICMFDIFPVNRSLTERSTLFKHSDPLYNRQRLFNTCHVSNQLSRYDASTGATNTQEER